MALKTVSDLARDLEARGADLEALAMQAVRIALKRGIVDVGRAGGAAIIAAQHLGYIRKDRRYHSATYRVTGEGRKAGA